MKQHYKTKINNIADIHSHILFDIDDGPDTIEESLALLKSAKMQNVSDIVLTPHFYADTDDFDKYIELRQQRYEELSAANKTGINLHLGSEVFLCKDLLLLQSVSELCINGKDHLLLEIPYDAEINDHILNMINQIISNYNVVPVIAHIDRYYKYIKSYRFVIDELIELGCELQLNPTAILERRKIKESKRLLQNGCISYLASDTHNSGIRKSRIAEAYNVVSELFGDNISSVINSNAVKIL